MKSFVKFLGDIIVVAYYLGCFGFAGLLFAGFLGGAWHSWGIWPMTALIGLQLLLGFVAGYVTARRQWAK
jgi:hypothetical protein